MCRKLKKLCAWALAVVTVLSVVPSSGMVLADQTTDENTANVEEVKQGTVYFKVPNADGQIVVSTDTENEEEADKQTITVSDEKTTLTDKDGNVSDVALTEEGYCLELTEDVGTTIHTEVIASEGYEVGTYHILSDTGDEIENKSLSSDNKYDVTVSKDAQVVEVVFNAIADVQAEESESEEVTTEETTEETTEVVEEEPAETTEEVKEDATTTEEKASEETQEDTSTNDKEEDEVADTTEEATEETTEETVEERTRDEETLAELERIGERIKELGLDTTTVTPATEEDNAETDAAFSGESSQDDGISLYGVNEYNAWGSIGSTHKIHSLTYELSDSLWQRTQIDVVDYWDGYSGGWDIVDTWTRGVIGVLEGQNGGSPAFCVEPGKPLPSGDRTIHNALDYYSQDTIDVIALIENYTYDHRMEIPLNPGGYPNDEGTDRWSACYGMNQLAIWTYLENYVSSTYYQGRTFTNHQGVQKTIHNAPISFEANKQFDGGGGQFVTDAINWAVEQAATGDYKCYGKISIHNGDPDGVQKVAVFKNEYSPQPKQGNVNLKKVTGDTSLTSGNSNYSYAGAQYGVYNDSTLNNRVGILTTDELGNSNTLTLDAGTYYVKEIKAPKGYMLDTTTHTVTIEAGQTATVNSSEPPISVTINLTKVSAKPDVTNNNKLYSLQGAQYGVYHDSSCTQFVTSITTDASGHGSVTDLPLNNYWVKETKASQGFDKDGTVYPIDATSGNTAVVTKSVTSTETPLMDPVGLLLQKVDSETGNGAPVDEGILQDAQFEVKLYDTIMTTNPGAAGHRPIWSAVMKTDSKGRIMLLNSYRVSGDQVPTDTNGTPSLPFGTITFKEIKAPSGYLLNSTVIVQQITGSNGSLTTVPQYPDNGVTQKEQAMTLKIIKVQNGTTLRIPNAQFKWTLPDGSTHTYTTNSNGEVYFKGLEWGKHTIEEVKVPDGYSVNKNKITFTVNQDNTISGVSGATVTDTDGNFTLVIDNNNLNPTVTYENKPAPFDLHIHKINDVNFSLQGAEFTLYSDAACKTVVSKATTNSNGDLTFKDLIVGKTYYMKETDAPKGYRIPVNDDGSAIVYKIRVTSTPVKNEFTFYVNDKAYNTSSTGSFTVTGTKADRICNMTIINERGKQLPETGSSMMLVLVIAGVVLMGGAIVISAKKSRSKKDI